MSNNIFEAKNLRGLVSLFSQNKSGFTIIGLIDENTSDIDRRMVRKVLKRYSRMYPYQLFIIYKVQTDDIKQPLSLIKKEGYPIIYSIFQGEKIHFSITNATLSIIEKTMDKYADIFSKKFEAIENQEENNDNEEEYCEEEVQDDKERKEINNKKEVEKIKLLNQRADEQEAEYMESLAERKKQEEDMKSEDMIASDQDQDTCATVSVEAE